MTAALRKIIKDQRLEITQLKARIEELEPSSEGSWSTGLDLEGSAMFISGAMKEELAENDGWDDNDYEPMGMGGVRT